MSPKVKGRCRCWTHPPSFHEGHCCFAIDAPKECHDTYSRRDPQEAGDATVLVLSHRDLNALDGDLIGAHELTLQAGITYRQLDFWTRCGYLATLTDNTPGSGRPRVYSLDQVDLAREMARLTVVGLRAGVAHDVAVALLADGRADLGAYTLTPRQETA